MLLIRLQSHVLRQRRLQLLPRWFMFAAASLAMLAGMPRAAHAKEATLCGSEVKEAVASTLAQYAEVDAGKRAEVEADVYKKYSYCAGDAQVFAFMADPLISAARECGARVTAQGSLYYEEMACCGYDPQRRQFACPLKVKQPFGFGANPLPGTRQFVLHCVQNAQGVFVPVGDDSVHLANAPGLLPPWQFAVIAAATQNLQLLQPMNGVPRRARSILSWNLRPTSCDYQPIWGDALDYDIRLDQ